MLPPRYRQTRHRLTPIVIALLLASGILALAASFLLPQRAASESEPRIASIIDELARVPVDDPPALTRAAPANPAPPAATTGTATRAGATMGTAATAPKPAPARSPADARLPAPSEALGISRPRSLSSSTSGAVPVAPVDTSPFSVLVIAPQDPRLKAIAAALPAELARLSINTAASDSGSADVVVALVAGKDAAVWYCDGSAGGRDLAATLAALPAIASAPPPADTATMPALDCPGLQAPRPRAPIALLELPPTNPALSVASVAEGLSGYFLSYGRSLRRTSSALHLAWPARGPITSFFGPAHPLGIDIGQMTGDIVAATDGTVFWAGGNPCCSYGRFVVIDGPGGIRTLYAHFDSIAVKTGDKVRQGQRLGVVGCTGACTGNHLHFEVIDNGVRRNPLTYLP